jgi:GH25 family lysozyme M1 (1,4-beta-N-acetylmuramidase)
MLDLQWISTFRRLFVAVGVVSVLAGCSALGDDDDDVKPKAQWASAKTFSTKNYPKKGDNDPHPGVARVHRLPIHGIDVSRWQSDIDWTAVRDAGTRFAFIKATEGDDNIDPNSRVRPITSCTGAARPRRRRPGTSVTSRATPTARRR